MKTTKTKMAKLDVQPMKFKTTRTGNKLIIVCRDEEIAKLLKEGFAGYSEFVGVMLICACLGLRKKNRPKGLKVVGEVVFGK